MGIQDAPKRGGKSPFGAADSARILIIYGSIRSGSLSLALALEAAEVAERLGADVKVFDPSGIPLEGNAAQDHPKIRELHGLVTWSDGQVWCSPEHHASMSGVMKLTLDSFPCDRKGRVSVNGKALTVAQVSGGAISCNALNDMQRVGRSIGMYLTAEQVSVGEASRQFDSDGRLIRGDLQLRLMNAMRELIKLSILHRDPAAGERRANSAHNASGERAEVLALVAAR